MRLHASVLLAAALAVSSALSADELAEPLAGGPPNLLTNGGFDTSIAGWSEYGGATLAWNALDAAGSAASGSILVTNTSSTASKSQSASQCVTLQGSKTYMLRLKIRVPSGQARTGGASGYLYWYEGPSCTGDVGPTAATGDAATFDSWSSHSVTLPQPEGFVSLRVMLRVNKTEAGGEFRAHFDDITLTSMETLTIPAAASIHGAGGTFFHSDLWVMNRSYTTAKSVTVRYRCFTGQTCSTTNRSFSVSPRKGAYHEDVVGGLLASPETAGAIEILHDPGQGALSALSRVYTPSLPAPTTGSAVPALKASEARTRAVFLGLGTTTGTLTRGFRSNAGAYNPNPTSVNVTFTVYNGPTGALLGTPLTRTWAPREAYQINNIFAAVGATNYDFEAGILVVTASAPVFPYVTVIDNQSGDSVFVPASEDEAP